MDRSTNKNTRAISESLKEYARGIAGGLLFSFPLLYTMEVWIAGYSASPFQLLILIVVTFLLLLGYNRFAGMHPDASWRSILVDSVEEMGIGFIISFGVLYMLKRIEIGVMALDEIVGKVVVEAMVVSIGVSIGTSQLGMSEENKNEKEQKEKVEKENKISRDSKIGLVVLAFCGSILIGGNVAPTEEVLLLAIEAKPLNILLMAVASLIISVMIVFFSNFKGTFLKSPPNFIYNLIFDTCLSYLAALTASAFALWFFGRFDNVSYEVAFAQCVVLGVLSSLGASAGRLLIK
jgi:putative integral membrane protein (TIGR02587 family)